MNSQEYGEQNDYIRGQIKREKTATKFMFVLPSVELFCLGESKNFVTGSSVNVPDFLPDRPQIGAGHRL